MVVQIVGHEFTRYDELKYKLRYAPMVMNGTEVNEMKRMFPDIFPDHKIRAFGRIGPIGGLFEVSREDEWIDSIDLWLKLRRQPNIQVIV